MEQAGNHIHHLNSHFYTQLNKRGFCGVKSWTKDKVKVHCNRLHRLAETANPIIPLTTLLALICFVCTLTITAINSL